MGDSVLCVRPTKLRIGDTKDLIIFLESTNARSCRFYHSRQVGAERKRRGRAYCAFALANECVPWSNSRSGDPDQKFSCRWSRTRYLLNDNNVWCTKAMDSGRFHVCPTTSAGNRSLALARLLRVRGSSSARRGLPAETMTEHTWRSFVPRVVAGQLM